MFVSMAWCKDIIYKVFKHNHKISVYEIMYNIQCIVIHVLYLCVIGDPYVSQNDKPGFLSDDELKKLLVEVI